MPCQKFALGEPEESKTSSEILTEEELIAFLRIPEISQSKNFCNVIEHLKRHRDLPRFYICNRPLYLKKAVLEWIERQIAIQK